MSMMRSTTCYLVVSPKKWSDLSVRAATKSPTLKPNEVAIEVSLRVPDQLFKRPALKASVTIPDDAVSSPVINAEVLDNVKTELERQTGLDVQVALVEPQ